MNKKEENHSDHCVADFCGAMETISPTALAQDWDNVGLLAGDEQTSIHRVLLCIDLTRAVVDEAIREGAEIIMAYHPPIFKPVATLRAQSRGTDAIVFDCIRNGIAIYSTHTALDAADGGTNDVMAKLCGIEKTDPLEFVDEPGRDAGRDAGRDECKLVVFVPQNEVDKVADAMFSAGAGHIGDYSKCSYRLAGEGTFFGGDSTRPAIGQKGKLESVNEIRLETVVANKNLPAVVTAMIEAHSYDEPAFDLYPLQAKPVRGIGRVGRLAKSMKLRELAARLKKSTAATCVQTVGGQDCTIERAVIVVGAAGSLPFRIELTPSDVIITGEIRHHDGLTIQRTGCNAIALGHWASERPVLASLAIKLETLLPGVSIQISQADADPFQIV